MVHNFRKIRETTRVTVEMSLELYRAGGVRAENQQGQVQERMKKYVKQEEL